MQEMTYLKSKIGLEPSAILSHPIIEMPKPKAKPPVQFLQKPIYPQVIFTSQGQRHYA